MAKWSFGNGRPQRPTPGEPLYTLAEIATRLGVGENRLKGLMGKHAGFKPWDTLGPTSAAPFRSYYRLSDARRWWRALQEKKI